MYLLHYFCLLLVLVVMSTMQATRHGLKKMKRKLQDLTEKLVPQKPSMLKNWLLLQRLLERRKMMFKPRNLVLLLTLTLASCGYLKPPVVYKPIQVPPLNQEIQPMNPNLSDRLSKSLSTSPQTETQPSSPSTPASSSTTK